MQTRKQVLFIKQVFDELLATYELVALWEPQRLLKTTIWLWEKPQAVGPCKEIGTMLEMVLLNLEDGTTDSI